MELDKIPVLIFWGEEDGILPSSLMQKFKKHVPHAVILKIPETDHAAFLQKPTSLFQMMLKFVQGDTLESLEPGKVENLQLNDGEKITLIKA
jgi:pimeloyl-ACP methyl ester carboxylesterase